MLLSTCFLLAREEDIWSPVIMTVTGPHCRTSHSTFTLPKTVTDNPARLTSSSVSWSTCAQHGHRGVGKTGNRKQQDIRRASASRSNSRSSCRVEIKVGQQSRSVKPKLYVRSDRTLTLTCTVYRVKEHCIQRGFGWADSLASTSCTETEYYEDLLRFYRYNYRVSSTKSISEHSVAGIKHSIMYHYMSSWPACVWFVAVVSISPVRVCMPSAQSDTISLLLRFAIHCDAGREVVWSDTKLCGTSSIPALLNWSVFALHWLLTACSMRVGHAIGICSVKDL